MSKTVSLTNEQHARLLDIMETQLKQYKKGRTNSELSDLPSWSAYVESAISDTEAIISKLQEGK